MNIRAEPLEKHTVDVVVDVPLYRIFTYLSPSPLLLGQRVIVPFGTRRLCAVVVNSKNQSTVERAKLRPILTVLEGLPPLPASLMQMLNFVADYYHAPLGSTVFTALPKHLREPKAVSFFHEKRYVLTAQASQPPARYRAQHTLWQVLNTGALTLAQAKQVTRQAGTILENWIEKQWVECVPEPTEKPALEIIGSAVLTLAQRQVCEAIQATPEGFCAWVLHGVTGSGKTEVYLHLIAGRLLRHQQILVLVPEINLTPQLVARFMARFPNRHVVVQHSFLADKERLQGWLAAWEGEADIVIGTRLSVFTPLPRLGLIVVDEEHDDSFKQQDGLRYQARDLAVWRAQQSGVPIILGSATPSLETWYNVEKGRYHYLCLIQRAHPGASLPSVKLVDTRRQTLYQGFTPAVLEALRACLARQQMSMVFINRRGFSPVLACTECGWVSACPHCSAKLVLHLKEKQLRCHYCGQSESIPMACPGCGNPDIKPLGEGTQRLEVALAQCLPEARIWRVDRDTTYTKAAWDQIYSHVHAGKVDILLGTQMLTKGHDFERLALVVVLNADSALYSADFRASERLFAQMLQVAGRAGRADTIGEVLIQTQWPEHPLYQAVCRHDFTQYARTLLQERGELGLPPYVHQAILRAESANLEWALDFLQHVKSMLGDSRVSLLGPAPALMQRLAKKERAQLILESASRHVLHLFLTEQLPKISELAYKYHKKVRWILDVDPREM